MAPKSDSTEGILTLLLPFFHICGSNRAQLRQRVYSIGYSSVLNPCSQNRPLNSQNAADSLQKFNLKKAAVQKALDTLADTGKISFKEYGKQKIYIARQDQFDIPNAEELNQMKDDNAKLQQQLGEQKKANSEIEGEIKGLQSNLTLEQIRDREAILKKEVREMEEKLLKMRGGVALVRPEERKAVSEMFSERLSQWRKRKRMFKDLWDSITENSPKDLKEFKEELGIEYDEDVGVSLQSFSDLVQPADKRRRFK
ncbi:Homologous-pairing protein 2 homolog [Linum perenne]